MGKYVNICENPNTGMMCIDFFGSTFGIHVNRRANISVNK